MKGKWRIACLVTCLICLFVSGLALADLKTECQYTPGTFDNWVFSEAPMLQEMVEKGLIPPLEERLPIDFKVIEPVEEIGQFGGTWRTVHLDPGMGWLKMIMYDGGVRWNRDLTGYIPGVFRAWEFSEDGTSVTFFMRRGLRWSDGYPFTTEDIRFWWEALATNPDFGFIAPPWWGFVEGELMTVDFIDRYTFRFTFVAPNWIMPHQLASGFWNWEPMMAPRHYLSQFHPWYNLEMEDYLLLDEKRIWNHNPDHPTLFAWHVVEHAPGERVVFERNPFYWKVDSDGNQLPYIDRIESIMVPDAEMRVLKVLAGEIDATFRGIESPRDLPLLLEGAEAAGIRHVPGWINAAGGWPMLVVNQDFIGDEYIRSLLRDKNFRRGLSVAIDRHHMNEVIWFGLGTVQQATISEDSWHFEHPDGRAIFEEWAASYAEYDVELANQLLDAAGLDKRDPATGFRLRSDTGEVFEMMIDVGDWGGVAVNEEAAALFEKYWEAVGIKVVLNFAPPAEIGLRWEDALYMVRIVHMAEMDLWTFPDWVFPTGAEVRGWPMQALWFATGGDEGEEPGPITMALMDLFHAGLAEPDVQARHRYVWKAIRIHIDEGPFYIGVTGGLPMPVFVKTNFRNVPEFGVLGPWAVGAPGAMNPEQFFFDTREE